MLLTTTALAGAFTGFLVIFTISCVFLYSRYDWFVDFIDCVLDIFVRFLCLLTLIALVAIIFLIFYLLISVFRGEIVFILEGLMI